MPSNATKRNKVNGLKKDNAGLKKENADLLHLSADQNKRSAAQMKEIAAQMKEITALKEKNMALEEKNMALEKKNMALEHDPWGIMPWDHEHPQNAPSLEEKNVALMEDNEDLIEDNEDLKEKNVAQMQKMALLTNADLMRDLLQQKAYPYNKEMIAHMNYENVKNELVHPEASEEVVDEVNSITKDGLECTHNQFTMITEIHKRQFQGEDIRILQLPDRNMKYGGGRQICMKTGKEGGRDSPSYEFCVTLKMFSKW